MDDSRFVAYVGPPELHDGSVLGLTQQGDTVTVLVQGDTGCRFVVEFQGVAAIQAVDPEEMKLYALVEMTAPSPLRRFVFANWEDDDRSTLELLALEFRVVGGNLNAAEQITAS